MGITAVCLALQSMAQKIEGIKAAPLKIVESAQQFPFAMSFPRNGTFDLLGGWNKYINTVYLDIHCSRTLLEQTLEKDVPFLEKIGAALQADPTIGGSGATIVSPVRWEFGKLTIGTTETIGYRFIIQVKLEV